MSNNSSTIADWLATATKELKTAGIPSARLDAELLLAHALGVERTWLIAHADDTISADTSLEALKRRLNREPLAYIRGWQEFYGRRFTVSSDVLIPRPESETIVDFLKEFPAAQKGALVDVGTGSGCLGITAALEFPDLQVILCDISEEALTVAQKNIASHTLTQPRIKTVHSNLLENIDLTPTTIIANLPYVDYAWQRSPETEFEPSLALFADIDGLALIYQLIDQASDLLAPQGYLLLEADRRQMKSIAQYAHARHFTVLKEQDFVIALQKD